MPSTTSNPDRQLPNTCEGCGKPFTHEPVIGPVTGYTIKGDGMRIPANDYCCASCADRGSTRTDCLNCSTAPRTR